LWSWGSRFVDLASPPAPAIDVVVVPGVANVNGGG
jgi:hypothetical protein